MADILDTALKLSRSVQYCEFTTSAALIRACVRRSRLCYSVASVVVVVCLSSVCLHGMHCGYKRCVLEQKLLLTAQEVVYEKSIGSDSTLNISEIVSDTGLVPKDHE